MDHFNGGRSIALWLLWPAILTGGRAGVAFTASSFVYHGVAALFTVAVLYTACLIATFPGEALHRFVPSVPFKSWLVHDLGRAPWSDRISARSSDLIDKERFKTAADIAAARETISFAGRHLEYADLSNSDLRKANFAKAHLIGAKFIDAHIEGANFNEADLTNVTAWFAHAEGAQFKRATLHFAKFVNADLQGTSFNVARLNGASFEDSNLGAADMSGAESMAVNFQNAILNAASFAGASLQTADFTYATYQGASFRFSCLRNAELDMHYWGADFTGASTAHDKCEVSDAAYAEITHQANLYLEPEQESDDAVRKSIERLRPGTSGQSVTFRTKDYVAHLAVQAGELLKIGCSPVGAPYVIQGILLSRSSAFPEPNIEWHQVGKRFSTLSDCAGAQNLDSRSLATLMQLSIDNQPIPNP